MRLQSLMAITLAGILVTGCDKIPFLNRGEEEPAVDSTVASDENDMFSQTGTDSAAQTQASQDSAAAQAYVPAPPRPTASQGQFANPIYDEPWVPTHTGTVSPGMTFEDLLGVWGDPVASRAYGNFIYVYFRNGCERTCGMFDLAILEGGQVVDAVVRTTAHVYSGTSSSPDGRVAQFTPPDMPAPMPVADTTGVIG